MPRNIQLQISEQGIEAITVPYAPGQRLWIDVLSRSSWALELLHGSIRHYVRSLKTGQQHDPCDRTAPALQREKSK